MDSRSLPELFLFTDSCLIIVLCGGTEAGVLCHHFIDIILYPYVLICHIFILQFKIFSISYHDFILTHGSLELPCLIFNHTDNLPVISVYLFLAYFHSGQFEFPL